MYALAGFHPLDVNVAADTAIDDLGTAHGAAWLSNIADELGLDGDG